MLSEGFPCPPAQNHWLTSDFDSRTTHSLSGDPSQQFAFMWQCGHSHRVEIGSNSLPQ
jgi:hypothetical protein